MKSTVKVNNCNKTTGKETTYRIKGITVGTIWAKFGYLGIFGYFMWKLKFELKSKRMKKKVPRDQM